MTEKPYGEVMDELDHANRLAQELPRDGRKEQIRIQALGAAISRRDWHATEVAYAALRDAFDETESGRKALEDPRK